MEKAWPRSQWGPCFFAGVGRWVGAGPRQDPPPSPPSRVHVEKRDARQLGPQGKRARPRVPPLRIVARSDPIQTLVRLLGGVLRRLLGLLPQAPQVPLAVADLHDVLHHSPERLVLLGSGDVGVLQALPLRRVALELQPLQPLPGALQVPLARYILLLDVVDLLKAKGGVHSCDTVTLLRQPQTGVLNRQRGTYSYLIT